MDSASHLGGQSYLTKWNDRSGQINIQRFESLVRLHWLDADDG
jgi:hypothetical protein